MEEEDQGKDYFAEPNFQLVDPDTLLLMYRDHIVHLRGRDGHPGNRSLRTAVAVIEELDRQREEFEFENAFDKKLEVQVFLSGIWYDCKNPNVHIYLVTEPSLNTHSLGEESILPSSIYGSVFRQTKEAVNVAMCTEDGQMIQGHVAEYVYTGGYDYWHHVHKFFGRHGLLRGLARIECEHLEDFVRNDLLLSHPTEIVEEEGGERRAEGIRILSYEEFKEAIKNPPRGRYSIGDALTWGIVTPESLRKLIDEAEPFDPGSDDQ
ncbi:MAG: hypothetical protein KAT43_06420 [Nanoarchaeota archaeon]|nr:hypothetical protein [Nanoarchaeota archaeon]